MKRVVTQYEVKPEQAEHDVELIRDFYDESHREPSANLATPAVI